MAKTAFQIAEDTYKEIEAIIEKRKKDVAIIRLLPQDEGHPKLFFGVNKPKCLNKRFAHGGHALSDSIFGYSIGR